MFTRQDECLKVDDIAETCGLLTCRSGKIAEFEKFSLKWKEIGTKLLKEIIKIKKYTRINTKNNNTPNIHKSTFFFLNVEFIMYNSISLQPTYYSHKSTLITKIIHFYENL